MIHVRRTVQIAPGRQADAAARTHEWVAIFKEAPGVTGRAAGVTTGTLGRLCLSSDYEDMGAREEVSKKGFGSPKGQALMAKTQAEYRDGTSSWVPNTLHDEFWRDA